MNVSSALRSGARLPVERSNQVLPFYLLATSVLLVARVPLLIGSAIAYLLLASQGRIQPAVRAFARLDQSGFDASNPGSIPPSSIRAFQQLVTPSVVAVFGLSALLALIFFVLARAATTAATFNAVYGALVGGDPLESGVRGVADQWKTFLGVFVLRLIVSVLALLPFGVSTFASAAGTVTGTAAIALAVLGGLVSVILLLLVALAFVFVGPAVVADGVGWWGGFRRSVGFIRRYPIETVFYVVVAVGAFIIYGIAAGIFSILGASRVAGLVPPLLLLPILDGFKTALYTERTLPEREFDASTPNPGAGRRFVAAFRDGLRQLGRFLVGHPLANLASVALLAGSIVVGWSLTAPYGIRLSTPGNVAQVFGTIAVGPFVTIAANNWLVAAGMSYGGLALGIGTAGALLTNGLLVGALAGVFDLTSYAALVIPHGIVELPALAVAGGLGFHLGAVGWQGVRGRQSAADVGRELKRAFEILLGLAIVLVIAAFIEAFLTPHIAAWLLGR